MQLSRALSLMIVALSPLVAGACASRTPELAAPRPGGAAETAAGATGSPGRSAALAPHAVVDMRTAAPLSFAELADRAARAEVVYFGELHDDPGTHRLQLALLEGIAARRGDVILSLEMFERDAQRWLDDYLAGRVTEEVFLAHSRPWPNYAADYRPLVELAKARGWPVLASNVPRPLAALVARGGVDTLQALPPAERGLVARELECPRDSYFERFAETMGSHPGMDESMVRRFYEAQCIKDETMAESIVAALAARPGALVVHMNGAFHSDFGEGVPARVARRRPGSRAVILSGLPVADPAGAAVGDDDRGRADYLIFTLRPGG